MIINKLLINTLIKKYLKLNFLNTNLNTPITIIMSTNSIGLYS